MQYVKEWRGEGSRKRAAEESPSNQESSRKRTKDENTAIHNQNGRRQSTGIEDAIAIGTVTNKQEYEYKIRGTSTTTKTFPHSTSSSSFPTQSASSPPATEAPPSPSPSMSMHPDRRAKIINAAFASASASTSPPSSAPPPAPLQRKTDYPLSPSPEHINDTKPEEQRPKPLHSISHPTLRMDTVRALNSLDLRGPDYSPVVTARSNGESRDSPDHDPPKPPIDTHPQNSNASPSRQLDAMPPPLNVTKITQSNISSPKAASPSTNGQTERRQLPINQTQMPLLDSLNGFAQSIVSVASLTARRDLAKLQAVGQQKERDRQSKFKSVFLTTIEDAESRLEGVEKVSMGIEKQIGLSSMTQYKVASALASQLQRAEIPVARSSARDRGRLGDDIADIKADLKAVKKEIDNTRDRVSKGVDNARGRVPEDLTGLKADLKAIKTEIDNIRCRIPEDLTELKADLKATGKEIGYLNREAVLFPELHKKLLGLATKDEIRDLITKDELRGVPTKKELRRVTADEVRKHVTEALVPTENKLASLTLESANLNRKIEDVGAVTHKHYETAEAKDQQQSSRFSNLDTSFSDMQMELNRLELIIQKQRQDSAAVKGDLDVLDKVLTDLDTYVRRDPSNSVSSLKKLVMRNSGQIQLLQQDWEKLNETVRQNQGMKAASRTESLSKASEVSVRTNTRIEEEMKLIRSDLDALKLEQEEFKKFRHELNALKADREKVGLIRTDLDSLINEEKLKDVGIAEEFEAVEESLNKQRKDLAHLQKEIMLVKQPQAADTVLNRPPTPPFASASTSPRESDSQKLQNIEMGLMKLTNITQGLELFVNSQQQKFDGLTADHVVQSMIHQMQQMYPQHPGNLNNLVHQTVTKQAMVENYLGGNLKDRLANIDSQIAARVGADSKIEKITQFTAESRSLLADNIATVNILKQSVEGLSNHSNRIDELADRVTTVEGKYVEAIGDLQTDYTDLVRSVTKSRHRNGIGSTRNTPGEVNVMSRSSKSVEPHGTVPYGSVQDSDDSDTPLSQRSDRGGIRRDREERRAFELNLKRKAADSDNEEEDSDGEVRPTIARKVPKRRNISGNSPLFITTTDPADRREA